MQSSQDKNDAIASQLDKAISDTNAENAFITLCAMEITRALDHEGEAVSEAPRQALLELAASHLYPCFGNTRARNVPALATIASLLQSLHSVGPLTEQSATDPADHASDEIRLHVRSYSRMVRGTRYITQIIEQIEHLHGPFEERYRRQIGVGPRRAIAILDALQKQLDFNYRKAFKPSAETVSAYMQRHSKPLNAPTTMVNGEEMSQQFLSFVDYVSENIAESFPVSLQQLSSMQLQVTDQEWGGLISLIGLSPASFASKRLPIELKSRPLFTLPDQRLLFVDYSSVLDGLCTAYDRLAKEDLNFLNGHFQENQTVWIERKVIECLRRVFPEECVFSGLHYPNPERAGHTAEMDAAVHWKPFMLLIEVKAKQFRLHEGLENFRKLRDDLLRNVQEASSQADRAMRFIQSAETVELFERKSGRKLKVAGSTLRRVFKLSITLRHLADLATQLANLKPLKLFTDSNYPLSVSLEDLDTITRFCESPEVLLHYIERRLQLQQSERNITADELDLFGTYLENRLHPSLLWDRKPADGKPFTKMIIGGGSKRFDDWHDSQLGLSGRVPEIRLEIPPYVGILISALRNCSDEGSRLLSFLLLSLSPAGMRHFDHLLSKLPEQSVENEKVKVAVFVDGPILGVICAGRLLDLSRLRNAFQNRIQIEKYVRRADFAFGFAIDLNNPAEPFHAAVSNEEKWCHDPEIERLLENS